jgi:hypothetical protein
MATPYERFESIVDKAAQRCEKILRGEVNRVLEKEKELSGFVDAMGQSCFYDLAGFPVFEEKLTIDAQRVIRLAEDMTTRFGSTGLEIFKIPSACRFSKRINNGNPVL